ILSGDAEAFRLFLGDRWTPCNVDEGWFRPVDDRFTEVRRVSRLWVRRDAGSPWVLDVAFSPETDGRWTSRRHLQRSEHLDEAAWMAPDGLRYSRPEVTLMFKATQAREKDRQDARAALPLLDARARRGLRGAVVRF